MAFEAVEIILADFSVRLMDVIQTARFVEKNMCDRISDLIKETKLEDAIAHLTIQFDLAKRQRILSPLLKFLRSISFKFSFVKFASKDSMQFDDEIIPINKVLAALFRLESLLTSLYEVTYDRIKSDDEIFKPSNIDQNFVCEQIEAAISDIEISENIGKPEKARLIIYLNEAKVELIKDPPSWKKVVGALVIIATILSGIANAPKAIDNVNSALKHILGNSVERQLPNFLPPPKENERRILDEPGALSI